MKFGIIAEGRGDCAVLTNILIGLQLIEGYGDVKYLRPKYSVDWTDTSESSEEERGSWTLVKKDCTERDKFEEYLFKDNNIFEKDRRIIIQLDSAECDLPEFGVVRPEKSDHYCDELIFKIKEKIKEWLNNEFMNETIFAVCVEEMEAWLLALYGEKKSEKYPDPKRRFEKRILPQLRRNKKFLKDEKRNRQKGVFQLSLFYSKNFQKKKKIKSCLENNQSLKLFVESLPTA